MELEEQKRLGKEAAMRRHPQKFPEFTKQDRINQAAALPEGLRETLIRRGHLKEEQ